MDIHDLDLDVYNACKRITESNEDAIFYFRFSGDKTNIGFTGMDANLASGFVTCLKNNPELYEILDTALTVYEENYIEPNGYSEN